MNFQVNLFIGEIIEKMAQIDLNNRYKSFYQIKSDISNGVLFDIDFNEEEKDIYLRFADSVSNSINYYTSDFTPCEDVDNILKNLKEVIKKNSLEKYIQRNADVIRCFVINGYSYNYRTNISTDSVKEFFNLLSTASESRQQIILDNIKNRLQRKPVKIDDDDLPF